MENKEVKESVSDILLKTTSKLAQPESYETVYTIPLHGMPMPDSEVLVEIVVATLHIVFLQFSIALNCGSPSDHEIIGKLLAFFCR